MHTLANAMVKCVLSLFGVVNFNHMSWFRSRRHIMLDLRRILMMMTVVMVRMMMMANVTNIVVLLTKEVQVVVGL